MRPSLQRYRLAKFKGKGREGKGREGEDIKFFLFGDESSGGYAYHLVLEGDVLTGYFIGSEEFYRDAFYLFDSDTPEEKVWVAFERNDPPKKPADKE